MRVLKVRRIGGGRFFLDLKEEWIVRAVAFEVDAVVTQTYRAGTNDFEGDLDGAVQREKMLALGLENFSIGCKGVENLLGLRSGDSGEVWLEFFEAACAGLARDRFGEQIKTVDGSGALGFNEGGVYWNYVSNAVDLEAGDFQEGQAGESAHLVAIAHDAVLDRVLG